MPEKEIKNISMIKQSDAAILREGLAYAHKYLRPDIAANVLGYLARFANSVREYCECPQQSWMPKEGEGVFACLDCGKRVVKDMPKIVEAPNRMTVVE